MSETVLVTGAAGFIGGHLCESLLQSGHRVIGVDNFDPATERAIGPRWPSGLERNEAFVPRQVDIRDTAALAGLLRDVSAVVHLAARAGVRQSIADPAAYMSANVEGTASVLEACRAAGVSRIVFASSSSVYGNNAELPFREDSPGIPISPYAASKRAAEHLCQTFSHLYGLSVVVLRFFTVFGPRQRPDLAIYKFTRLITSGMNVQMFGDGSSCRDYTFVSDATDGVCRALDRLKTSGPGVEVFNIGQGRPVRLSALIAGIGKLVGVEPAVDVRPEQPGDVRGTCADISKAAKLLGYGPSVSFEDGLSIFVDWFIDEYGISSPTAG